MELLTRQSVLVNLQLPLLDMLPEKQRLELCALYPDDAECLDVSDVGNRLREGFGFNAQLEMDHQCQCDGNADKCQVEQQAG